MQAKRLEDYSLRNQHLIMMARPDATLLAGYKQWRALGRQVRKGEHGIAIGAPVTVKEDDGTTRMVNVRGARVFDIEQTEPVEVAEAREAVNETVDRKLAAELERTTERERDARVPSTRERYVTDPDPEPLAEIVTMVDPFGRRTTLGCPGCDHPGTFEHDWRCKHRLPEEDTPEGDAFEDDPDPVGDGFDQWQTDNGRPATDLVEGAEVIRDPDPVSDTIAARLAKISGRAEPIRDPGEDAADRWNETH